MQTPIADAVLLSLLVVFFAVHQRQRPENYFRFWLTGWALVLMSVVARLGTHYTAAHLAMECLRQDALVCGGIAFQFSSVVSSHRRRAAIITAFIIALPICLGLNLIAAGWVPRTGIAVLIMVGEAISLACAWRFSRNRGRWLFVLVAVLCVTHGALMLDILMTGRATHAENIVLSQIFLTAGLLILGQRRKSSGQWVGALGFFGWGLSHLMLNFASARMLADPLFDLWIIPKYLVAFGMILRIFAEKNDEIARLSARYRGLYEDHRVLYEGNPHPMWVYDQASQAFLSVNKAAITAYGFTEQEFLARKVSDLAVLSERDTGFPAFDDQKAVWKRPARHRRANGTEFDVDLTEHTILFQDVPACFVLAVDSTEREQLNRELVYQAQHDVLTGLPNRMVLEDRLMHWLARCGRESSMGALLTVDIDHFKQVNDTYGHLVGDECLKATADRLRSRVRQVDTIARTGGEEFTIVIGNLRDRQGAEKICRVLLQVFDDPILIDGLELKITISIGAAMYPADGVDAEVLRRHSDQALYEAKRAGRNRTVFARRPLELPAADSPRMADAPETTSQDSTAPRTQIVPLERDLAIATLEMG